MASVIWFEMYSTKFTKHSGQGCKSFVNSLNLAIDISDVSEYVKAVLFLFLIMNVLFYFIHVKF